MYKQILKCALAAGVLLMGGCAAVTGGQYGGVNKDVRDYAAMLAMQDEKVVEYSCNFDKVARQDFTQFGDYCQKAANEDYVSYFIPPDIQSTTGYKEHLAQSVKWLLAAGGNSPVKYYQIYTDNDYERLKKLDIPNIPPTSFAVMVGKESFATAITKRDLLARIFMVPGLEIRSLVPEGNGNVITDYSVTFQITPYAFKIPYADDEVARYLGLPAYRMLTGSLDAVRKLELRKYNDAITSYWKNPTPIKDNPERIELTDYVYPGLSTEKFQDDNITSVLTLPVAPPLKSEGRVNEFLPVYRLQSVEIISSGKDGVQTVVKTFDWDDILRTVLSYDDHAALFYKGPLEDLILIRYTHVAEKPRREGMRKDLSERLGVSYIYSDMAATIHTDLYINRYYPMEQTPRHCVDDEKFMADMAKQGITPEEAEKYLSQLDQGASAGCTQNQVSIIRLLPAIIGN